MERTGTRAMAAAFVLAAMLCSRLGAQGTCRVTELSASSYLIEEGSDPDRYSAGKAFDGRSESAWVEGRPDAGIGEKISIVLAEGIMIEAIDFQPGLFNPRFFASNNRVSTLLLEYANQEKGGFINFSFADSMTTQRKTTPGLYTNILSFEIRSVYPGSRWNDTCISEIALISGGKALVLSFSPDFRSSGKESAASLGSLLSAIEAGNAAAVRASLDAGADPNSIGGVPEAEILVLGSAIAKGDPAIIRLLLKAGADPNQDLGGMGWSYLMASPTSEIALLLLEYGADAKHEAKGPAGYGPIHCAVEKGWEEVLAALLKAGADPNAAFIFGNPLSIAEARGDAAIIAILKAAGAKR